MANKEIEKEGKGQKEESEVTIMGKAEKSKTFLRECIEKMVSSWQERRKTIRRGWQVPFIFAEWICEQVSYFLERWAFLDILGHAGRLTILVAVIFYFAESGSRRKAKHYQAWQVINSAQGKRGSGGRNYALQDLNKDKVPLMGIDISKAYLPHIKLENANLWNANLAEADLWYANLVEADLGDVNLTGADLLWAHLSGADLSRANLTGVDFTYAEASGAILMNADLTEADLSKANLAEADIRSANLNNIRNWQHIKNIELANIYDVNNPPDGFIEWASENGAVSIEFDYVWKKLIQKTREEKRKQEADNSIKDQKKAGEK